MFKPAFLSAALFLTGCSSIYHPQQGWVPEGYSEIRADDYHYEIRFQTYRGEDWDILQACLMYRAAQLGNELQFEAFTLGPVSQREHIDSTSTSPATGSATTVGVPSGFAGTDSKPVYGASAPVYVMEHTIRSVSATVNYQNDTAQAVRVENVQAGLCPL